MKVFITLLCMAAVSMALPNKRLPGNNAAESISRTVAFAHKKDTMKRMSSNPIQMAFDWTDGNKDGHITASEFASFYIEKMPVFGLSRSEWISAFRQAIPSVDSNGNGKLEIDEYAALAAQGGYGRK